MLIDGKEWTSPPEFEQKYEFKCEGANSGSTCDAPPYMLGKMTTIAKCLRYADCRCSNYLDAVDEMESLAEPAD